MKIWATSLAVYRTVAIDTLFERACLPRTPIPWPIWLFNLFAHYQTVTGLLSRHNGFCSRACVRRSAPFILRALYWFALIATPVAWLRCVASFGNNYRQKRFCAPRVMQQLTGRRKLRTPITMGSARWTNLLPLFGRRLQSRSSFSRPLAAPCHSIAGLSKRSRR